MAGDWFPFRLDLHEDPAIVFVAHAMGQSQNEIVGAVTKLWAWFSSQSRSGHAAVTRVFLDRHAQLEGLCEKLIEVGWLKDAGNGTLTVPRWERWLGESAKKRLNAALRQRRKRLRDSNDSVTPPSRSPRDKGVTTVQDSTVQDSTTHPSGGAEPSGPARRAPRKGTSRLENRKEPACMRRFTDGWCARFLAAKGSVYGFNGGVDGKHALAILKLAGLPADPTPEQESAAVAVALERADTLLGSTDDWYVGKGVDLGTLRRDFNRLASAGHGSRNVRVGRADAAPHSAFKTTRVVEDF